MSTDAADTRAVSRYTLPAPSSPKWNGFRKGHPFYPSRDVRPSVDLRTIAGRRYLDFIGEYERTHTSELSLQSRVHLEIAASLDVAIQDLKERQLKGQPINLKEYRLLINAQRRAMAKI